MLSASTGLQFLILWFKLDQSISKFWRKAGQLKESDQEFQYHFCKQNKVPHLYLRDKVFLHLGQANLSHHSDLNLKPTNQVRIFSCDGFLESHSQSETESFENLGDH